MKEKNTMITCSFFSKKFFNRELYIRYTQPLWRGRRNPLLHIPKVGREAAYSALWYCHVSRLVVETASPCGETEWSEIPELICLDTRGLTMSPCVKIINRKWECRN